MSTEDLVNELSEFKAVKKVECQQDFKLHVELDVKMMKMREFVK